MDFVTPLLGITIGFTVSVCSFSLWPQEAGSSMETYPKLAASLETGVEKRALVDCTVEIMKGPGPLLFRLMDGGFLLQE